MSDLVTIDIGGTHARFAPAAIGADGTISLGEPITLRTADHTSFRTAWEAYLAQTATAPPRGAAISVAGPIGGEVIRFTNNPWMIRPAFVREELGVEAWTIVNDFEAVAHAVARADPCHFTALAGPDRPLPAQGTLSVVGPGTGLGVAHLWRDGAGSYRVQATEGGHVDFAPLDSIDDAILARLRQRHLRVSVERVVSGPGLVDIHEVLAAIEGRAITPRGDAALWQAALDGSDALAAAAAERFCLALGGVAGDIALTQGAIGVVIAGGLGLRIKDCLLRSGFAQRFCAKGRFASMMAAMPVKLITHPQPGLLGAAAAFAMEHGV